MDNNYNRYREEESEQSSGFTETSEEVVAEEDTDSAKEEVKSKKAEKQSKKDNAKIEELQSEVSKYRDMYLRTLAEAENFKKRVNDEKIRDRKYACFGFAEKLIDSIDLFDKVVSYKPDNELLRNYLIGFEMINNQLKQVLEAEGVTKIVTKDQMFDPRYHNAVETDWDETKEDNVILVEMKTGYMFKDRVLRASMVKVNKKPIEQNENSKEEK